MNSGGQPPSDRASGHSSSTPLQRLLCETGGPVFRTHPVTVSQFSFSHSPIQQTRTDNQQQQQWTGDGLDGCRISDSTTTNTSSCDAHQQQQLPESRSRISVNKRPAGPTRAQDIKMHTIPTKKARTAPPPAGVFEIPTSATGPLSPATAKAMREAVQSPLFFSNSSSRHFSRRSTDSISELASPPIGGRRDEGTTSVTTVKLPSADVRTVSPAVSSGTPGSLTSSADFSISTTSPDFRTLPPNLQLLRGIGVIELLENDDRPTFLIDLAASANSNRPGLPILYYNASLRRFQEIHHILAVESDGSTAAAEFEAFKSWAMCPILERDRLELTLPSAEYQGIVWTKSTIRQRFRFISGNINISIALASRGSIPNTEAEPVPTSTAAAAAAAIDEEGIISPCMSMPITPLVDVVDQPDYFGDVATQGVIVDALGPSDAALRPGVTASAFDGDILCQHPDAFTNQVLQSQPFRPSFDWTQIPMSDNLPDHIKFIKTLDWSATMLGPIEDWPYELRVTANLIMGTPHPACLFWGPDRVCIYNEAYKELAGQKHPKLMGQRHQDGWSEVYNEVDPIFRSAWESGQATMKHDDRLFINRHGYLEETVFSWNIIPIIGRDGQVAGLYNGAFDNTRRQVNERRMRTLREIGEQISTAATVQDFWPLVTKGLEYNEVDIPFSLIYSCKADTAESDAASTQSSLTGHSLPLTLVHASGVPSGHSAAPSNIDIRASDEGFAPYMLKSLSLGGIEVVLSTEDGSLPEHLIDGFEFRGYGDQCKMVVVNPILPTTGDTVTSFIIMGVNPRRPYDEDYKLFMHLLSRQLATSMASVMLFEEEIRRGQRAARLAALDRQELSMQLLQRTQEATASEFKFTRMAEFAPVGMFIANSRGIINYCNDMWGQISGHSRSEETIGNWMSSVRDEDREALNAGWKKLLDEKVTVCLEFRFKGSQRSGRNTIDTWVLMSAYPEKNFDGTLQSIFGCITDISSQKWAEKFQNERREEAVELKRQQENFIDITSHEMRNPLSAILQCADQIVNNITAFTSYTTKVEVEELLESCADAANTINLCASHQKRIVDDILTLSKLDSNLLTVTPVDEQPAIVVQRTLKMFEPELITHDIDFEFRVDDTFEKHGIKFARLDPSRLSQVLINLMTNAIKFTQGRDKRSILVTLSVSRDIAEVTANGTHYFARNCDPKISRMNIDDEKEWGSGDIINLHCSVEDTGRGLSDEELKILFQRFQQASPRTHVQYGGSGLGLFISRILTEMQGGQIGVTSTQGNGSIFNFYIQCRKSNQAPNFEPVTAFKIESRSNPHTPPAANNLALTPTHSGQQHINAAATRPTSGTNPQLFDVLIVEDNLVNQRVLQRQLRDCGNNIFVANHGLEALQTLQRSRFWLGQESNGVDISVILMDLEMPVMDGMTCAKRIRELEREGTIIHHIPIIAVTAYARPEQIADAKAAGIDDVISKPFRIPELIPKIQELVSKYNFPASTT